MEQMSAWANTETALRVGAQAQFGSCSQSYMTDTGGDHPQGYCQITCGRCNGGGGSNNSGNNNNNSGGQQTGKGANGQTCPCTDTQPDSSASCQQQVRWLQALRHTARCTLRMAWLPRVGLRIPHCHIITRASITLMLLCSRLSSLLLCPVHAALTHFDPPEAAAQACAAWRAGKRVSDCQRAAPQAGWGNCGQAFMTNPTSDSPCGHCMRTCGRCNASS